ncbi:MAG TPA: hypothetical protein VFE47_02720 [Tepidisphaeraceae bacterium]|nr:hypothetical protein [Tepidisphaeraceae bacterium]
MHTAKAEPIVRSTVQVRIMCATRFDGRAEYTPAAAGDAVIDDAPAADRELLSVLVVN